jgi:uncharacterized protein with von Willebrand factor type A (vWA) domain
MTAIDAELQTIIKDNKRFHFTLELAHTTDPDHKDKLNAAISKLNYTQMESNSAEKHKKIFDDIDRQVYAQPWNKLQKFHKETRIELFVNEKFKDNKNKQHYRDMLLKSLENGELNTVKIVTYNSSEAKITDISILKETETGEFIIELKKPKAKSKVIVKPAIVKTNIKKAI